MRLYRGLANVLGREEAVGKLQDLCAELAGNLEVSDPGVVAKLEALSGIGRIAPDIFAKHATTVIKSGLQVRVSVSPPDSLEAFATCEGHFVGVGLINICLQALLDCKLEDLGNRGVMSSVPVWARYTAADALKARAVKVRAPSRNP